MNIGEVSKLTGLSIKQIRDYEKIGLISIERSLSGYRIFPQTQIERLKFIARSREVGFSLIQIKELLSLQDNQNRKSREIKRITDQHIVQLSKKITQLQAMKDTLQSWSNECRGDDSSHCEILNHLNDRCSHKK